MKLCPIRLDVAPLDSSPFPLDLSLIKQHCAVDGDDFDDLLEMYARAAILWAEGAMHRTIFARSHSWVLRDLPRDHRQEIRLPRGKTQSIESIVYRAGNEAFTLTGASSTPVGTGYSESLDSDDGGLIVPNYGTSWPTVDYEGSGPVVINFTAGYEDGEVPEDIMHALFFSISDFFENRGTADMDAGRNFDVREALISPYRLIRWY